jgi:hypothetical protein
LQRIDDRAGEIALVLIGYSADEEFGAIGLIEEVGALENGTKSVGGLSTQMRPAARVHGNSV